MRPNLGPFCALTLLDFWDKVRVVQTLQGVSSVLFGTIKYATSPRLDLNRISIEKTWK